MTLAEAIKILSDAGVDNPRYDARELFSRIGKIPISELVSPLAECGSAELISAIERRKNREPLQYIIGEVDFYHEVYKVSSDCLIPRQDTEILVDYAVKNIPDGKCFLDLCTGSGCIAVSTLKNTKNTRATALDISKGALALAKHNAEKNGVCERIEFVCADAKSCAIDGEFFAILSNPPYVTETAYKALEPELYFEPDIAFVGGASGLDFYEKILALYNKKISPDGFFAFEIGYDQGESLKSLASSYGMRCDIIKDYSGLDRVAILR